MGNDEKLLQTIDAIYAAGLDAHEWQGALNQISCLFGAAGATFEIFEKPSFRHRAFYGFGIPPAAELEYLDQYAPLSPRIASSHIRPTGNIGWDYEILDEAAMRRDPFYSEFLPRIGLRYFISAMLRHTAEEVAVVAVQRTAKQGHVDAASIELMRRVMPHLQRAFDMTRRLEQSVAMQQSLAYALDCMACGVVLIRRNGAVTYANKAAQAIARRNDGFRIKGNMIDIAAPAAHARFAKALVAAARPLAAAALAEPSDFPVPRSPQAPPYLVSVRPVARASRIQGIGAEVWAIVFVQDPLDRTTAPTRNLRDVFGLTQAEAQLAVSLQQGITAVEFARDRGLSLNTVYTHLRRVREKTGSRRMAEVIRKLNDLQVAVRPSKAHQ